MSPNEQQKERYDQHIWTTVFLHKNHMPQKKYKPRNGIYLGEYVLQDEHIEMSTFNQLTEKNMPLTLNMSVMVNVSQLKG